MGECSKQKLTSLLNAMNRVCFRPLAEKGAHDDVSSVAPVEE